MNQVLALGSDVLYQLSEQDAAKINKRRLDAAHNMAGHIARSNGVIIHVGNDVRPGEICSARVVKCWDADPSAPGDGANERKYFGSDDPRAPAERPVEAWELDHRKDDPRVGENRPKTEQFVNLIVFLDGSDHYWVTSRRHGDTLGSFHWPGETPPPPPKPDHDKPRVGDELPPIRGPAE